MDTDLTGIYKEINNAIKQPEYTKDDIEEIKIQIIKYFDDKIAALPEPILCACCGKDFFFRENDGSHWTKEMITDCQICNKKYHWNCAQRGNELCDCYSKSGTYYVLS